MIDTIEIILSKDELEVAVETYKQRIRLVDWRIHVVLAPQSTHPGNAPSSIEYNLSHKTAIISIATPDTYMCSLNEPQNMLRDLYNKMIHLLFFTVKLDGLDEALFEHGIEVLANALVNSRPLTESEKDAGDYITS